MPSSSSSSLVLLSPSLWSSSTSCGLLIATNRSPATARSVCDTRAFGHSQKIGCNQSEVSIEAVDQSDVSIETVDQSEDSIHLLPGRELCEHVRELRGCRVVHVVHVAAVHHHRHPGDCVAMCTVQSSAHLGRSCVMLLLEMTDLTWVTAGKMTPACGVMLR